MAATPVSVQALSVESVGQVSSLASGSFTSTPGNQLAVAVSSSSASTAFDLTAIPLPVTDNYGNTYQIGEQDVNASSSCYCVLFYCPLAAGGSGHIVTVASITTSYLSIAVLEVSGASSAYALDQGGSDVNLANHGGSTNPHVVAGTLTPSVPNTLVVSAITNSMVNNNVPTPSGTAVLRTSQTGTTNMPIAIATDARSTTDGVIPGFTYAPDDFGPFCIVAMNFKPDSGLPQDVPPQPFKGGDFTVASPSAT